jgi:Adenosine deaminase
MREAGLLATLNTDDPAMTDLDLGKEYRSVAEAQGLDFADLAAVALDGIEACWLDDVDQRVLRREFSQVLEDLRPQAPADHQRSRL